MDNPEVQDPRPLPPTRNYSKSFLVRLLEINNVCFLLFFFRPGALPPLSSVSCGWILGALRCWMFNITRAIIYAWRAGQRPHNLDQWAELACSITLRLVPYGVYLRNLVLERLFEHTSLSYALSDSFSRGRYSVSMLQLPYTLWITAK